MAYGNAEDGSERRSVIEVPLRFRGPLGLVAMIVGLAFVLLLLIPAQLVPPVLSILSFVIACVVAGQSQVDHHDLEQRSNGIRRK